MSSSLKIKPLLFLFFIFSSCIYKTRADLGNKRINNYTVYKGTKVKDGLWILSHPDSSIEIITYKRGSREGKTILYYSNGQFAVTGKYKKDKYSGTWKFYNKDGKLEKEIIFKNGIPEK